MAPWTKNRVYVHWTEKPGSVGSVLCNPAPVIFECFFAASHSKRMASYITYRPPFARGWQPAAGCQYGSGCTVTSACGTICWITPSMVSVSACASNSVCRPSTSTCRSRNRTGPE
jgi:hypothetical protein